MVVFTPRRGAAHSARSMASSGTKYGVVMISSWRAAYMHATNMSDMALWRVTGPVSNTWATAPSANCSTGSCAGSVASSSSPFSGIHPLKNRHCICRTTGPWQRSSTSTQGAKRALTRNSGSAQFWLPQ